MYVNLHFYANHSHHGIERLNNHISPTRHSILYLHTLITWCSFQEYFSDRFHVQDTVWQLDCAVKTKKVIYSNLES